MDFDDDTPRGRPGLAASLVEMRGTTAGFAREMRDAAQAMRGMDSEAKSLARSLGSSLTSAFDRAIFGGAKLSDVFRKLATDVLGRTVDLALKPVQDALTGGIGAAIGGIAGALGFARGGVLADGRVLPFANGAAFDAGRVRAFARGGVIGEPTLFPMRGGTGLMGEAGPEAIMPLARGPDGRLGVSAATGPAPVVNVTIRTPDIEGFRRSRGQVAAELARAVARGTGRL